MVDISTVGISVGAKMVGLWKHLAESLPKTYRSVLALFLAVENSFGAKKSRRWEGLAESVPKTYRSVLAFILVVEQSSFGQPPHGWGDNTPSYTILVLLRVYTLYDTLVPVEG